MAWAVVVAFTQLMLQVNSKFGHGEFGNIIRGKYNTPKEEKKIFMLLDLNSSTTIAEQLGNETYHELLKDFFADITNPILDNRGEIRQYVGDDVVVVWSHAEGIETGIDKKALVNSPAVANVSYRVVK
jgi:adenylate cyclase